MCVCMSVENDKNFLIIVCHGGDKLHAILGYMQLLKKVFENTFCFTMDSSLTRIFLELAESDQNKMSDVTPPCLPLSAIRDWLSDEHQTDVTTRRAPLSRYAIISPPFLLPPSWLPSLRL